MPPAGLFQLQSWTFCPEIQELNMNDLIVYAGIGVLLIGLPVLFARWKTTK
jgi:hypothetical protein